MFFDFDDYELLTNPCNGLKYQNQKLFTQSMIALVLVFMHQPFEYVTASKFEGAMLLNATCDELVAGMKLRKKQNNLTLKENSEWIDEISSSIVVLLSDIFSKLFYYLQDDELGFAITFEAKVLFDKLLSDYADTEIYTKIIGLYSLVGQSPAQVEITLFKDFYSNMSIFTSIIELPFVEQTMNDLITLLRHGQEVSCQAIVELLKNNKAKIANKALHKAEV